MDQVPGNGVAKEAVNVPLMRRPRRPKEREIFPVANTRHELNPQQVS
jgi:hypothetical protein